MPNSYLHVTTNSRNKAAHKRVAETLGKKPVKVFADENTLTQEFSFHYKADAKLGSKLAEGISGVKAKTAIYYGKNRELV